ncbi:autotransporter domain-containing protein [Pseudomonas sp. NPDC007930]|uniref:autotransporter domain-containing protein n=1 Tax=Pseudomonas sp. NPDC007930 TaxID=3364417 RepID=UPI0036EF0466
MGRLNLNGRSACSAPLSHSVALAVALATPAAWGACSGSGSGGFTVRTATAGPCAISSPGKVRITQAGSVTSSGAPALSISGLNGAASVLNAGSLRGSPALAISNSQLSGSLINYSSGQLIANGSASSSAVSIDGSRLSGGVTNNGLLQGGAVAGSGLGIHSSIVGALLNRGNIQAADYGLQALESTVQGNVLNSGSLTASAGQALAITASKVLGEVASTGTLNAGSYGLAVTSSTLSGGVRSSGSVNAGTDGVRVVNSRLGASLLTSGSISAADTGIELSGSQVAGDVINRAEVNASNAMLVNGKVSGQVLNAGNLQASADGLGLYSATVRGLVQNSGGIRLEGGVVQTEGPQAALGVHFNSTVAGVYNSGTLFSDGSAGLQVDNAVVSRQGVRNLGGSITAHRGIDLDTAQVAGGVINTGLINAQDNLEGALGVRANASQISGGLANSGSIIGGDAGILLDASSLSGNLANSGSIQALGAGIAVQNGSTLAGNLLNSGQVTADGTAVRVFDSQISGNLSNSGLLQGGDNGLLLRNVTVGGSLLNSGRIAANNLSLVVSNSTVTGGIVNTGVLAGPAGVVIEASRLGSFSNRGTVQGGSDGVFLLANTLVSGDFNNSGNLRGNSDTGHGLQVQDSHIDGQLIHSGSVNAITAINVINSGIDGGITLSGQVLGEYPGGYALYIDDDSQVPLIRLSGQDTLLLQGIVRAHRQTVQVTPGSTVTLQDGNLFEVRQFSNAGTLAVAASGIDPANPDAPPRAAVATIKGDYSQTAGATFSTRVADGQTYGKLVVTGTATLPSQAKVFVDVSNPTQPLNVARLNDVISAGTLASDGTFQVSSNSQLFNFNGVKDGNTLDLALSAKAAGAAQAAVANNAAARGAARVLDAQFAQGSGSALAPYFASATSQAEVANAISQSLPLTSSLPAAQFMQEQITASLRSRLQATPASPAWPGASASSGLWLQPFGGQLAASQRGGQLASSGGTLLGADGALSSSTRVGLAFAYGNSAAGAAEGGGAQRAKLELYQFEAYLSHRLDADLQLDLHAGMGQSSNSGRRDLAFGGASGQARSQFTSQVLSSGAALSQRFALSEATTLTPSLSADYLRINDPAYREQGPQSLAPLLLKVDARSTDQLLLGFDTRLSHALSPSAQFSARAGVAYDVLNQPNQVTARYAGAPDQRFSTSGQDLGAWVLRGGLEFTAQSQGGTQLALSWTAQTRTGLAQQVGMVQVSRAF